MKNIKEVIEMCLEELEEELTIEFIGVQKVVLSWLNYQQLQEKNWLLH